jgi:methyl coenzyme M reductase alpha subunit
VGLAFINLIEKAVPERFDENQSRRRTAFYYVGAWEIERRRREK